MRMIAAPMLAAPMLAAVMTMLPGAALAQSKVVRHAGTPTALILQGVTVNPGATTIYLSGQLASPVDPANKTPAAQMTMADYGDTKTQTISVLTKIKALLASKGFTMADAIKLTVFVAGDPKLGGKMDFAGMNDAFKMFFGSADNPTTVARSTVQVAALVSPNYLVEIEAIAAR